MLECSPVSTPMDGNVKLLPHEGSLIFQLSYSRIIGSLMYAKNSTRLNIAYAVGKLGSYNSNLGPMH